MNIFNIIILMSIGLLIIAISLLYSIFKKIINILERLLEEK